jgi:TetR/AcrR family transcriptional repressor of nem operon
MSKKGVETREKILDTAQGMILDRGFSGVSIDKLIDTLGMTKGAFFHHFKNKKELATDLIKRYSDSDLAMQSSALARAKKLSSDPLQQLLITVGLYQEYFGALAEPYPGCLLASYVYELQLFDDEIKDTIKHNMLTSRENLARHLAHVAEVYPPRIEIDITALADQMLVIVEGAFILAKSLHDPKIVVDQLQHYRQYLELVFGNEK